MLKLILFTFFFYFNFLLFSQNSISTALDLNPESNSNVYLDLVYKIELNNNLKPSECIIKSSLIEIIPNDSVAAYFLVPNKQGNGELVIIDPKSTDTIYQRQFVVSILPRAQIMWGENSEQTKKMNKKATKLKAIIILDSVQNYELCNVLHWAAKLSDSEKVYQGNFDDLTQELKENIKKARKGTSLSFSIIYSEATYSTKRNKVTTATFKL